MAWTASKFDFHTACTLESSGVKIKSDYIIKLARSETRIMNNPQLLSREQFLESRGLVDNLQLN
jgi:hypothetical protein